MNYIPLILLAAGFFVMQALIGGAKMAGSLPAYILVGVAGVFSLFGWKRLSSAVRPRYGCIAAAVLLAGYVLIRGYFSPVGYLARTDMFMVAGAFVTYLLAAITFSRPTQRMTFLWILFAYAACHIWVGAIQFTKGNEYMALPGVFRPPYLARASGFYICPNHLAGLLEMLTMLAVSLCCWGRGRPWVRIAWGYAALMCLAGVGITGSRGGYLSVAAGLLTFTFISLWMIKRLAPHRFVLFGLCSFGAMTVVLGAGVLLMKRSIDLAARLDRIYEPTNDRLLLWPGAIKQFLLSPWDGTGSGTFLYYGRIYLHEKLQRDPGHVHNDYLELLAEYGVAGCVVMLIFLVVHFRSGFSAIGRIVRVKLLPMGELLSNEAALAVGVVSALVALLLHSVIDFNLHIPANTLFVGFLFGMLANPTVAWHKDKTKAGPPPAWLRLAPVAAGIPLIALAVPYMMPEIWSEMARMAVRDRNYPRAVEYSEKALAKDSKNSEAYYYLGEGKRFLALTAQTTPLRMQFAGEAVIAYQSGLKIFPRDLHGLVKCGLALDMLGEYDAAESLFEAAVRADPNLGNVYAYYGTHYLVQKRWKRAAFLFKHALDLGEDKISPLGMQDIKRARERKDEDTVFEFAHTEDERDDTEDLEELLIAAKEQ